MERRGRKKKTEEEIIKGLLNQLYLMNDGITTLHKRADIITQRINYYLKTRRGCVDEEGCLKLPE